MEYRKSSIMCFTWPHKQIPDSSATTMSGKKKGGGIYGFTLQGALEGTDWDALYKLDGEDTDDLTDCISEYI